MLENLTIFILKYVAILTKLMMFLLLLVAVVVAVGAN